MFETAQVESLDVVNQATAAEPIANLEARSVPQLPAQHGIGHELPDDPAHLVC